MPLGAARAFLSQTQLHVGVEVDPRELFPQNFQVAGGGDHGGVVRRELDAREHRGNAEGDGPRFERCPELAIGGDAPGHENRARLLLEGRLLRALDERRHHRALKSRGQVQEVAATLGILAGDERMDLPLHDRAQHRALETAEAEIPAPVREPGYSDTKEIRISQPREAIEDRPSGVAETEPLRDLVVGLSRGVVSRFPQKTVPLLPLHEKEAGVTAGDDERYRGMRDRARRFEVYGSDVAFQMIDGDLRNPTPV